MQTREAHRMVRRRLRQAGVRSQGGKLELAQQMGAHASPRTTSRYDRRGDEISVDEIERISHRTPDQA